MSDRSKLTRLGERVDSWQQGWPPAGFVIGVLKKYSEDAGSRLAAVIAYYGFFSVFPAVLALTSVAGFVLADRPDLRADLIDSAAGQFPVIGSSLANETLGGNGLALVIGIGAAIWAGLGAILAAEHGLNEVWDVPWHDRPNAVTARLRGLLMLVVLGMALIVSSILVGLTTQLSVPVVARIGFGGTNLAVNIAVAWLAFQILTAKSLPWRTLLPGAVVAGAAYLALQQVSGLLVDRYISNASDIYGVFAVVIGLLAWFHILAQVTLIAAEVNVVWSEDLYPRSLLGDDLTDADERTLMRFQEAAARHEASEPPNPPVGSLNRS